MKKDRINDEPSKSNSPLDQTTDPSHQNPFPDMENLRYSYPLFFHSQPGPSGPARQPVRTPRQVELLHCATCQKLTGHTATHQQTRRDDTWSCQNKGRGHSGDKFSSQSAPQGKRTPVHTDTGEGAHDGHGHPKVTHMWQTQAHRRDT